MSHPNAPRQATGRQGRSGSRELSENEQISRDQNAQARMKKLFELIDQRRGEIEAVLPPDVPYAKFQAVMNMAIRREPKLIDCYGPSVIKAAIQSAYDGSLPDGREAVILVSSNKVPGTSNTYRDEARYQRMVYGLRKKMVEAGAVTFIDAKVVFSKEEFDYEEGEKTTVRHKPILDEETRGDPIAVYARAVLPNGTVVFDVLSKANVMAARDVAKTKNVWDGAFQFEMWKKTAIHRLGKAIPTATPIRDAEMLEMFEQFRGAPPIGLPAPARPTRGDFAPALEHQVEVPLDLGAFEGGYETAESKAASREKSETKKKPANRRDDPPAESEASDEEERDEAERAAEESEPHFPVPAEPPADDEGWKTYAAELTAALPEIGSTDGLTNERRLHENIIAKAPKAIAGQISDAFAAAFSDLV